MIADDQIRKLHALHVTLLGLSVLALSGPLPDAVRELIIAEQRSIALFIRDLEAIERGRDEVLLPDWALAAAAELYRENITFLGGSPGRARIAEIIAAHAPASAPVDPEGEN